MRSISPISNITAYFNGQEIGTLDTADLTIPASNPDRLSSSPFNWQPTGTLDLEPITAPINTSPRIRSRDTDLYDYLEDYIKNRNQENVLFINHNTSQREIEYNSIDDIIAFRTRLDEIIKEYYQR